LEARDCFDRALALHPEYAAARRNRQAVAHALHEFG
jgi:hypothetical protein